jgi:hypothetical protein
MEPVLLRPNRAGTYIGLVLGIVLAASGLGLVLAGRLVGIVALLFGAVGLYAGIGGLRRGAGLRLDGQGFYLRSPGKSWGAQWLEIEGFSPTRVRLGRQDDVDVVEIRYQAGAGAAHTPRHRAGEALGVDERYLIAGYGGLSSAELAELLERYRSA